MEMEIAKKNNDIHLLTERVNSLVFQSDPLNDDYARRTMNRLGYSLDTWVNSQFRDEGRLDGLTAASLSPASVAGNWRSATSIAIQSLSTEYLQATCDSLCETVELAFSKFATSKKEGRVRKLRRLVEQCIEFKQRLEGQENCYFFFSTSPGERYNAQQMQCIAVFQGE
ncbi:hypothetical protein AARAC_007488 [Aspergillus arachidicola]|uniref:Uncharacterized protein n=1 Tax=Aspergillus arachidicola TaxID=656916 RepID=A0A2G7G8Y6_9EURO|nr:hypothetical protein AARAC_007488 [Aspergillus arachidicola]